jgi:hypothetical protein
MANAPQYHAWLRNSRVGENRRTWLEQKRTDGYVIVSINEPCLSQCPSRNTLRKAHESSWKPTKTTSLKPGDGITLMRIFYLGSQGLESTWIPIKVLENP